MCRRKGSFRRSAVGLVCVLGVYLLSSAIIRSQDVSLPLDQSSAAALIPVQVGVAGRAVLTNHSRSSWEISGHSSLSVDDRVLVTYGKQSTSIAKAVRAVLYSQRIRHDAFQYDKNLSLQLLDTQSEDLDEVILGRYSLIIHADSVAVSRRWSQAFSDELLDYSRRFNVSVVHFVSAGGWSGLVETSHFTLVNVSTDGGLSGLCLNSSRDFYYLKSEECFTDYPRNQVWIGIIPAKSARRVEVLLSLKHATPLSLVVRERGITEVVIGTPVDFWMTKLLLLEVIRWYSPLPRRFGRERWVMVDIDDIFVAHEGLKMTRDDVQVQS